MKVLLINPNQFKNPPVIPIGLEYLATILRNNGHEVEILDLCFSENPKQEIKNVLYDKKFNLIGVTIRNIDSCIYFNNEFFLKDIRTIIQYLKKYEIPIVLGGSGFSASPKEILEYMNADLGIIGPGEEAILKLINDLLESKVNYKILDGWKLGINKDHIFYRGKDFDYSKYIDKDGILGFETQKGCSNSCTFCIEAKTKHHLKEIENVVEEIKYLIKQGYDHFHLCDSEFNLNLEYSINFCKAIIENNLRMKWALYMKPTPYNEDLFKFLKKSSAYLITLSINSDKKEQSLNNYTLNDVKSIIEYCKKYKIRLSIDLLIGAPDEPKESIEEMINFLKINRPDSVGVSFYYRIIKITDLGKTILEREDLRKNLSRKIMKNDDFLNPLFFNQINLEYVKDLIGNDALFKIEGFEKTVNYQRV
ncbi:MAG: radical SAM protein [Candidatus Lokiarchaeota archaeon]|nr:radical SAM protein [Candidatus Lokiarchaeota archaeon]